MPYIVTTRAHATGSLAEPGGSDFIESRRAVATLEEARAAVWDVLNEYEALPMQVAAPLSESGGTVGPLPDGTVIEIEQVKWSELARRADLVVPVGVVVGDLYRREIIATFNALERP